MDNLTHSLFGLTMAKAGLERLSPFATSVSILAANSPDVDVVVGLFSDRWTLLQHHRGITHSIVGTLALGILLPIVFYLVERGISRLRLRPPRIRFRGLLIASLLASATHPLMDWTNNYGVRPLLPWSGRWFYGDLTFVVDPYLWLVLGGATFILTSNRRFKIIGWSLLAVAITLLIFFLAGRRGGSSAPLGAIRVVWLSGIVLFALGRLLKFNERFGRRVAISALAVVVLYCGGLAIAHHFALQSAMKYTALFVNPQNEQVLKTAAMPSVGNPRLWQCVVETDQAVYRFSIRLGSLSPFYSASSMANDPHAMERWAVQRFPKPTGDDRQLVQKASLDRRAQILLGFSRFPVAEVRGQDCLSQTLVQFADVRYTEPGSGRGSFSLDVPVDCPSR